VDRAFELFPALRRHARRSAGLMSGGEMQMLVTARGMVGEPQFLILDEPFAGLSPKICDDLQAVLLDSVSRTGASLILIDQDVSRLASFADSLSMLASGRLQISGPTAEVVSRTDLFETFLGVAGSAVADVESIATAEDELEEIKSDS
jgi:branched-chain amino acid transport system ATP-binding protein